MPMFAMLKQASKQASKQGITAPFLNISIPNSHQAKVYVSPSFDGFFVWGQRKGGNQQWKRKSTPLWRWKLSNSMWKMSSGQARQAYLGGTAKEADLWYCCILPIEFQPFMKGGCTPCRRNSTKPRRWRPLCSTRRMLSGQVLEAVSKAQILMIPESIYKGRQSTTACLCS